MDFELTKDQINAIDIVCERYINGHRHAVISGFAGTGKSTIVGVIIDKLSKDFGIKKDEVIYSSFTGKASLVLRKKGNKNVSTLHKLLYYAKFNRFTGRYDFFPKNGIGNIYKIIVVDECSMTPKNMVELLAETGSFIIFLGDSAQLPPVSEEANNHLLDSPHVQLTEIMRQRNESEIVQVATAIREGRPLKPFKGKEVQIIRKSELTEGMLMWADQVLCSTNQSRRDLNNIMRNALGHNSSLPEESEKVICLHNYWDINSFSSDPYPLINGTIGEIYNVQTTPMFYRKRYFPQKCDFRSDTDEIFTNLLLDSELFEKGVPTFDSKTQFQMRKHKDPRIRAKIPLQFDYGYAITIHKAQGSEWPKILIMEEGFPFDTLEHRQSLYTAVTRAQEKCIIVLKD